MRIHFNLDLDDSTKKTKCRKCGHEICSGRENYKLHVPRAEVWPDEIKCGRRPLRNEALCCYYEYYCPNCYTMLDVEVSEPGSLPLWDTQISVGNP